MAWHAWSFEISVEGDRHAGETLLNVLKIVNYIFADCLAGEPLLPQLRCPPPFCFQFIIDPFFIQGYRLAGEPLLPRVLVP